MWGGSAPSSNPLPFFIPFWKKRYPFCIPFLEKRYPFHISTLEQCTSFLSPWNEVNEQYLYGKISSITRRNVEQMTGVIQFTLWNNRFPYPFKYLNLWNPYPFIYLKPGKGTPFGRSLPLWAVSPPVEYRQSVGTTRRKGNHGQKIWMFKPWGMHLLIITFLYVVAPKGAVLFIEER